ncbi:GAF domain-containing protein [Adhaeribacter swui]|uniref:GAF domain-containing protein n=2 Tax=Adhaeribacter swui TaxID=2086471 RepID=A0A7G7GFL2_9BACT|nr:GAF domain-containing protein [Adhaeribacter swui]
MGASSTIDPETKRLQALDEYQVLDTEDEEQYNNLVALASYICGTPISLISLITHNRQWFKAKVGLPISETPRSHSFCQFAIESDDVLEIPDALEDIRFYSNPLVTGNPNIRFYAGAPLVNSEGHRLGTLCVIDTEPRELSEAQKLALATLSEQVVAHFELRKKKKELEQEKQQLHAANQKLDELMLFVNSQLPEAITKLEHAEQHLSQNAQDQHCFENKSLQFLQENLAHLKNIHATINQDA